MSTEVQEEIEVVKEAEIVEEVVEKPYTLRALAGKDVFPMSKIISKIGINEFTKAFESQEIRKLASSFFKKKDGETSEEVEDATEVEEETVDNTMIVGIGIALEMANIILTNISACEMELYIFLSGLSGYSKEEVAELPMNVFLEMIVDVCRKEEFKDFIKVVSKLNK
ncbi:MAG: hypothetical protein R3Y58_12260 [Eubacteriales bacterium]